MTDDRRAPQREQEHDPLPWRSELDANDQINIYAADGQWVAILPHCCLAAREAEQRENADRILRAVNASASLREALRKLVEKWRKEAAHADLVADFRDDPYDDIGFERKTHAKRLRLDAAELEALLSAVEGTRETTAEKE